MSIPRYRVEVYERSDDYPVTSFHSNKPFQAFSPGDKISTASSNAFEKKHALSLREVSKRSGVDVSEIPYPSAHPFKQTLVVESVEHIIIQEDDDVIHCIALRTRPA